MTRFAWVHVGLPRTGTTSLQHTLAHHRDALQHAGILYPDLTPASAPHPHINHQHLGEALDGRRPPHERAELLDNLDRQLATTQADTILLSYESLCLIPSARGIPRLLATLFARRGFTMRTLATLKPQAEQLNSTYTWRTQFLREHRPFPAYLAAESRHPILDYAALLAPWHEAAPLAAVPTRAAHDPAPLLDRTLQALALHDRLAIPTAERTRIENRSPGPITVEVARRLRHGHARPTLPARTITRALETEARRQSRDPTPFKAITPTTRATLDTHYAPQNDTLAYQIWSTPWSAQVAPEPPAEVNDLAQTHHPESLEAAATLLAQTLVTHHLTLQSGPLNTLRLKAHDAAATLTRTFRGP